MVFAQYVTCFFHLEVTFYVTFYFRTIDGHNRNFRSVAEELCLLYSLFSNLHLL